ncbi:MAG: exodeoxyribonuclease VII small subunit [Leptothrix ochracea]|uniref:exodeoxyribonuclease VII small subunit n=1 Tax=Leptothrix ochracea TaxID=735331 RepID=UPI0034E20FC3
MPKSAPSKSLPPISYDAALAELEQLVQGLENSQLPLEGMLTSYQRGAELLGACRDQLAAVTQQVKVVENGQLKPWIDAP